MRQIWAQPFNAARAAGRSADEEQFTAVYKAGEYVHGNFRRNIANSRACCNLPKQRRFIGCKVDLSNTTAAKQQEILIHARRPLSKEADRDSDK